MLARRSAAAVVIVTSGALAFTLAVVAQQPPPPQAGGPPAAAPQAPGGRGAPMWEADFSKTGTVPVLSPADEAKRIWLQPGYKLDPVLTDPDIQEPAQIAFDGNGRMFVLEIRGYMQDADAAGELDPVGRISLHEDKDGDGIYETHHVFVDKLIFPRFVTPFGKDAILTKESNSDEVWKYTDTNGDGVADKKELFATGLGRLLNVEHQESGFVWGMDNWIYSTVNSVRIRWTPNGVLREPTGSNGGQWGVTQDNYGKMLFQAGASGMPGYFQFPIHYGNYSYPDQFEPDLTITWGAPVLIADMQGGMNAVRMPDGSLARATGAAGNAVFRGDRLPKDLVGDYFYGEVVARILRRFKMVKEDGLTQMRNAYPLSEFIRSTDPLFRPVDTKTAPDGTLYITDMYRGIVQESQWSGPGTYLRKRIDQYGLDKIVRHGRIWRLSYEGMGRRTQQPHMLDETAAQLVEHLKDPNGWWRDTAQQLLVLKQDKSVVPALKTLTADPASQLTRLHAMWTLEGLGAADAALVRTLMKDGDPQIRAAALRVSETLYKAGDKSFAADYAAMAKDPDTDVVVQALLTLNTMKVADAAATAKSLLASNKAKGVQLVANTIVNPAAFAGRGGGLDSLAATTFTPEEQTMMEKGKQIYGEVCFACHGDDGRGTPAPGLGTLGPALASSPRVLGHQAYVINALLHGLQGPINGTTYPDMMVPMGQNNDEWVAAIATYVRNSFGNRAAPIFPSDVAVVRAASAARKTPWPVTDLESSLPRLVVRDPSWKASASHNTAIAANGFGIQPWTSGDPQKAGMWYQVELPQPAQIAEVQFESGIVAPENISTVPGAPVRTAVGGGGRRGGGPGVAPGVPPAPAAPPKSGYPRAFKVDVSTDGATWKTVAQGKGSGTATRISFAPVRARFVRVTQTADGADLPPWMIQRFSLYDVAGSRSAASQH
ncbi:MAG TPA: discoidin domain-containing protein [Vicinamibacterales bacterium]|jgi:mono/diheme cytochrome c family protein/glucose/arabinose dehydrogenase